MYIKKFFGYRYGFNGMEKDDEVKGEGNHYQFGDYGLDARLGRRWNVDPIVKVHESPYAAFANNPIWFVDPSGLDTAIVNSDGVVIDKLNGGENALFHNNGNPDDDCSETCEILLNDPGRDGGQVSSAKEGDQLVHFVSSKEVNYIMEASGANDWFADVPVINAFFAAGGAYFNLDFGHVYLAGNLEDDIVSQYDNYSHWDDHGGFIVFTSVEKGIAYNIPDAGNFLFGTASWRMNIQYPSLKLGSELNEGFQDSEADQRAIRAGYRYGTTLKMIHQGSFFFPSFNDYETSKPSWFREEKDNTYRRNVSK